MEQNYIGFLGVKPGDVVEWLGSSPPFETKRVYVVSDNGKAYHEDGGCISTYSTTAYCRVVSRASTGPKLWRDMTPEEKGALLLAHHEGKEIEFYTHCDGWESCEGEPSWVKHYPYRVKPDPVVEIVTMYWSAKSMSCLDYQTSYDTHKITLILIDGEIQPNASVEKL